MAGAYLEIPLGRDYTFTTNVASRLANVSANMSGGTLYFLAKRDIFADADADAILAETPTANVNSNVVTVTIPRANTGTATVNVASWELSLLTAGNSYYTLDSGRLAIVEPVRRG